MKNKILLLNKVIKQKKDSPGWAVFKILLL